MSKLSEQHAERIVGPDGLNFCAYSFQVFVQMTGRLFWAGFRVTQSSVDTLSTLTYRYSHTCTKNMFKYLMSEKALPLDVQNIKIARTSITTFA